MTTATRIDHNRRAVVGLDLGKLADPSALALLTWTVPAAPPPPEPPPRPVFPSDRRRRPAPAPRPTYQIPTLKRWPLGTPYPVIVAQVVKFLRSRALAGTAPLLVMDATGAGEPVCDMINDHLRAAAAEGGSVRVTITAGLAVSWPGVGRCHVAKKVLVDTLQPVLGNNRLHVAAALVEAPALRRELGTFTVKLTAAGNESFEAWRERDHDDLVLAVALAVWAAETFRYRPARPGCPWEGPPL
jgi:hypothetical protein